MEVKSNVNAYCGPYIPNNYNQFFNPNICHVCKWSHCSQATSCNRCCMISYCSEKHQMEHYTEHKNICESIVKFSTLKRVCNRIRYNLQGWIKLKEEFMQFVEEDLGRELLPYEVQMFMYRKSCLICHQQIKLQTCKRCYSANFCNEHRTMFDKIHRPICLELVLTLNLNIAAINCYIFTRKLELVTFPDAHKPFNDTASFILQYFSIPKLYAKDTRTDWHEKQLIHSDYVSGPLTLYYGMKEANVLNSLQSEKFFTVHVIAANIVDKNSLSTWEILLHLICKIEKLTIVMIGPELQFDVYNHHVCSTCLVDNKKFSYECYTMLYHDYVSSLAYKKPTVVIGFQAEFNDEETWSKSIIALRDQDCPLLLTAKSLNKMQKDVIKIQSVLGTTVKPVFETVNRFSALRPYKEFHLNEVFYRNKHLIVFNNLRNPKQLSK